MNYLPGTYVYYLNRIWSKSIPVCVCRDSQDSVCLCSQISTLSNVTVSTVNCQPPNVKVIKLLVLVTYSVLEDS